ncbi:plasma membrane iron permease [Aureobasidium pullulans]|uniref:Plasma membrane iron permease n=1 Tax=Aureobasidium pullulans TaxID=5580 RepID=A0A4S8T2B5_AURPU|nr:plasma membrane iron permease [Aureobasidium pullulans]
MGANVFAVPIFFICFRESVECSIIVSVLLSFLKQTLGPEQDPIVYKKLRAQVWWGIGLGLLVCLIIGGAFIGAFYGLGKNHFSATEDIWEGVFGLIASIIISIMGAALLRVSKLQAKWRVKLAKALEEKDQKKGKASTRFKRFAEKYAMFMLPFITVMREGLEAVVFIGGVSLGLPATSFPLAVICGLAAGCLIGFLIYRGGNMASLQMFLIISTCVLYLVAAGLFSKAVWFFENNAWGKMIGGDASEVGSGPGSYDITKSVWHVNCCNPEINTSAWGLFNSVLGWQNSATYGSVLAYNFYWIVTILAFVSLRFKEQHGHWPLMKTKQVNSKSSGHVGITKTTGKKTLDKAVAVTAVQEIEG